MRPFPVGLFRKPPSGPTTLDLDLTQPTVAGLVSTRTGDTMYPARSGGTVAAAVTGADVFESREDGAGHWAFDAITNAADPFDFSGYTSLGTPTVTAAAGDGPDGSSGTTTKVADADSGTTDKLYFTDGSSGDHCVASVWVKDASPAPSAPGGVYAFDGGGGFRGYTISNSFGRPLINGLGTGASWRRKAAPAAFSGVPIARSFMVVPAGSTPVEHNYATDDDSATGAIEIWGASSIHGSVDLPLVDGSTSALVQQVDSSLFPHILDDNGDFDIEVGFISSYFTPGSNNEQDGTVWSMETPLGTFHVDVEYTNYVLYLDSTNLVFVGNVGPNGGGPLLDGQEILIRAWYKPSTNQSGIKITKGGCHQEISTSTATGTIGTPTSFYIGSNLGTAGTFYQRRYTRVRAVNTTDQPLHKAEGVIIGDSICAPYSGNVMTVGENVYNLAESRSRDGIATLAVTGQTAAQQLTVWQASPYRGDASVKWVLVMIGHNDVLADDSETTIVGHIQAIIDDVNTNNPTAKILLAPMIPMGAFFSSGQLAVWNAVNADVENTGSHNITGSNLIRMPLWSGLDDGSGNLLSQYAYGDDEHENDAGRQLIGGVIRSTLQTATPALL